MTKRMRKALAIGALVALVVAAAFLWHQHKQRKEQMKPALVYLVPENFVGPVYVFMNQPDGVETQPDPLGDAVTVPDNGIVKLKKNADDLIPDDSNRRVILFVAVNKDEQRRLMIQFVQPYRDEKGVWWRRFVDENNERRQVLDESDTKGRYHFLSEQQRNQRAISGHGGCRNKGFVPNASDIQAGKIDADSAGAPQCGEFTVGSPNEFIKAPKWLFETQNMYDSIQEAVDEANERLAKRKALGL